MKSMKSMTSNLYIFAAAAFLCPGNPAPGPRNKANAKIWKWRIIDFIDFTDRERQSGRLHPASFTEARMPRQEILTYRAKHPAGGGESPRQLTSNRPMAVSAPRANSNFEGRDTCRGQEH